MKKKEISAHLDQVGEALGRMRAWPENNAPITQAEVDALRCGAAMGIGYAIMALELSDALDAPELDAISIMETAVSELEKWRTNA